MASLGHSCGDLLGEFSMAFAILRTQKLKSPVAVLRSMKHAFRAQDTPNADPARTPGNTHIGAQDVAEGMAAFNDRLPPKFRKDAVQCIEYLVTASPDGMNAKERAGQDDYFADAMTWLRDRHGVENVIYAGIHRDETTPHMYAFVVPRDGEKLNAKKWLGGAKALADMQTEFAAKVGKAHGLQRGVERSKATHKTIRQHYTEIERASRVADQALVFTPAELVPQSSKAPGLMGNLGLASMVETPHDVARRLTERARPVVVEAAAALQRVKTLEAENRTLRKQVASLSEQVTRFVRVFKDLAKDQIDKLVQVATDFRTENAQKRERQQAERRELRALREEREQQRGRDGPGRDR